MWSLAICLFHPSPSLYGGRFEFVSLNAHWDKDPGSVSFWLVFSHRLLYIFNFFILYGCDNFAKALRSKAN